MDDCTQTKPQPEKNKDRESKKGEENVAEHSVPFFKLFSFAAAPDMLLMLLGSFGGIVSGMGMPLNALLFGELIDAFGKSGSQSAVGSVVPVALRFVYVGLGVLVASFSQVTFWMVTGERQASRIRGLYLKAILRQDVAFFDKESATGEVVGRMSGDTILIQEAMGEKVGKVIQLLSTFIGGFIIAFVRGWKLPANISLLTRLWRLDLSQNRLTGSIPPSLNALTRLLTLHLHNNALSGTIPTFKLPSLMDLSLQHNNLSGNIPALDLANLTSFDVFYNNLSGPIPLSLRKFAPSGFLGNVNLCGGFLPSCNQTDIVSNPASPMFVLSNPSANPQLTTSWLHLVLS